MELSLTIAIVGCVLAIITFVTNRIDKTKKDTKEETKEVNEYGQNQILIQYQLNELKDNYKDMSVDIKDIKTMVQNQKEMFREMIKEALENHIKIYHKKGE